VLAKIGLGRYPVLSAGASAPRYERLWNDAFSTNDHGTGLTDRPARAALKSMSLATRNSILYQLPTRRGQLIEKMLRVTARPMSPVPAPLHVIKSVHSPASAGFVSELTDADVVVIRRNPLNAVSSWLELGWLPQRIGADPEQERLVGEALGAPPPEANDSIVARHAWTYAALTRSLDIEAAKHPSWIVAQHEDLCVDPSGEFRSMFDRLDLDFTDEIMSTVEENDRPAQGYTTQRIASEQPERWRSRLTDEQVRLIRTTAESLSIEC
jgi:hypothetical protein